VHVLALSVVSVKRVPGFEAELFGDADIGHCIVFTYVQFGQMASCGQRYAECGNMRSNGI
jgi:hypothetical protein